MATISIIVPVYKVERYIKRCIDSILNQTFSDFDVILVDDGSPDNSGNICELYARKDCRIHVIHQKNGGVSRARNAGIEWTFLNSDSQWICFVDADDYVQKEYLELLYKAVKETGLNLSSCTSLTFENNVNTLNILNIDNYSIEKVKTEEYYYNNNLNGMVLWGKLYRKTCFQGIQFPVGKIYEDGFVTFRILFEEEYIAVINLPLYNYFVNQEGITHRAFSIEKYNGIEAREERKLYFEQHGKISFAEVEDKYIEIEKALFSIYARKSGVYKDIPTKYKMNWLHAMVVLNTKMDRDKYEALMVQCYPLLVKIQSYYHKIKSILKDKTS